jgi:6-phosphogluconolactonase (cycloisomerase 2 family)
MKSSVRMPAACFVLAVGGLAAPLCGDGAVLHKSGPIQVTADGSQVWVVNPDHDSVSRVATAAGYPVTQFPLPTLSGGLPGGQRQNPRGLDVAADGSEVWVACHDSGRVYVLSGATGAVLAEHVLHPGSGPVSVALSPSGALAVVTLHRSAEVAVFDTATRRQVGTIHGLFRRPMGIVFASVADEAWLSHTMPDGEDSHVTALDLSPGAMNVRQRVVLKSVNPKEPNQIPSDPDPVPEGGYIVMRAHIAQVPGTNHLWLPVQYQNFHNPAFSPDSTVQSAIHKIDVTTGVGLGDNRVVLTAVYAHQGNNTLLGAGWNA